MRNHREKPPIQHKEKAALEEIKKLKNLFISKGREPTAEEEQEIKRLRERLNNYTEIRRVWLRKEKEEN